MRSRATLALAGEGEKTEGIDPERLVDVIEGLAQARRREFASNAEMTATFRLLGT